MGDIQQIVRELKGKYSELFQYDFILYIEVFYPKISFKWWRYIDRE